MDRDAAVGGAPNPRAPAVGGRAWADVRDLARPFTLLAPWVGFLSAGVAALGLRRGEDVTNLATLGPLLLGSVMSPTLNAASNTLNQIYDRDIDAVNKPHRPIPSGRVSVGRAWGIALVFYAAALAMAWFADPPPGVSGHGSHACFWIVVVAAFLTWAYSAPPLRTKRLGWGANLTIAIPRGLLLKVAGWSAVLSVADPEPWYIGLIFGLFLIGATNTKDFADMEGDRAGGCRTMPVVLGLERAARLTAPFFVVPFLLIPVGAVTGLLSGNVVGLTVLGIGMAVYGALIGRSMVADPAALATDANHPSWRHMYVMMVVGQIGFAVAYWA